MQRAFPYFPGKVIPRISEAGIDRLPIGVINFRDVESRFPVAWRRAVVSVDRPVASSNVRSSSSFTGTESFPNPVSTSMKESAGRAD